VKLSSPARIMFPLLTITAVVLASASSAAARAPGSPVVVHQGVVTHEDIAPRGSSEPNTVVEPDVAVSPRNDRIAIAAAHDSRFADGGAVAISVAWTADGGATWHHRPVPGITRATGGSYDRGSDPVVAFGPDGTAYLSVLLIDATSCPTAVAVLRSTNGGRTWSKPSYAHRSKKCAFSDDKNWLIVDTSKASPHRGRLYQFWTPFISTGKGKFIGSPQVVRWSDDKGRTWSKTSFVTPRTHGTQNSQPMILRNGDIVDTYYDFGAGNKAPDAVPGAMSPESPPDAVRPAVIDAAGPIYAARSDNGSRTWSDGVEVTNNGGGFAPHVRCCLFAADIDKATHVMYVAWEGGVGNTDPVFLSWSRNGDQWSSPIQVSHGDRNGVQRVNVDVVARRSRVYVAYGTRTHISDHGGIVQQQLSVSHDAGRNFGAPISLGPRSVLRYAARAGGYFPGDYIGAAISPHRLYLVWAVSSKPRAHTRLHQVIYGATLRH
jgi:hypothetical protein